MWPGSLRRCMEDGIVHFFIVSNIDACGKDMARGKGAGLMRLLTASDAFYWLMVSHPSHVKLLTRLLPLERVDSDTKRPQHTLPRRPCPPHSSLGCAHQLHANISSVSNRSALIFCEKLTILCSGTHFWGPVRT